MQSGIAASLVRCIVFLAIMRLDQQGAWPSHRHLLLLQEETLEKAKLGLSRSMRRLNRTYQRSKSNHLLYLLLFVVGVFFVFYWW